MSTETSEEADRGDTYVGFNMHNPEHKRQLRIEMAERGYPSMAEFLREIVYSELDLDQSEE